MTLIPPEGQAAASGEIVKRLRQRATYLSGFELREAADTIEALERRVRDAEEKLDDYKTNVIEDMRLDRDTAEARVSELENMILDMDADRAVIWRKRAEAAEAALAEAQQLTPKGNHGPHPTRT
jgi:capsule polysaccharide export protein KpsE/RkpR